MEQEIYFAMSWWLGWFSDSPLNRYQTNLCSGLTIMKPFTHQFLLISPSPQNKKHTHFFLFSSSNLNQNLPVLSICTHWINYPNNPPIGHTVSENQVLKLATSIQSLLTLPQSCQQELSRRTCPPQAPELGARSHSTRQPTFSHLSFFTPTIRYPIASQPSISTQLAYDALI